MMHFELRAPFPSRVMSVCWRSWSVIQIKHIDSEVLIENIVITIAFGLSAFASVGTSETDSSCMRAQLQQSSGEIIASNETPSGVARRSKMYASRTTPAMLS
jgi:hypothetical protein